MKGKATVLLFIFPMLASAEVYKCVVDGVTLYSEHPCGEQSQVVKLRPSTASDASQSSSDSFDIKSYVDDYVAERKHKRKISELEQKRNRLERKLKIASRAAKYGVGGSYGSTIAIRQSFTNLRLDLEREIDNIEKEIEQEKQLWAQSH